MLNKFKKSKKDNNQLNQITSLIKNIYTASLCCEQLGGLPWLLKLCVCFPVNVSCYDILNFRLVKLSVFTCL